MSNPNPYEIRSSLMNFAQENNLTAASIVTCVGSLLSVKIRAAGAEPDKQNIREFIGHLEITSLVGTFDGQDCHFHIEIADENFATFGGHLKSAIVDTTAEIVIVNDETVKYDRAVDETTGFLELFVKDNKSPQSTSKFSNLPTNQLSN